jgi:hypothetical protein
MNNADFNTLLKNVRAQATVNGRRSVIAMHLTILIIISPLFRLSSYFN